LGYEAGEVDALPDRAVESFAGVGNPFSLRRLAPGEKVVDVGSGGGFDSFIAAGQVGPGGQVVGIDMTAEMIDRARANAVKHGLANVEFPLATIDRLPLADESVDCLISNCVINLAPDKPAVFREMFRVLKPGGRVAVSDIALKKPLPEAIARDVMAYVGCIAGAVLIADYERGLREAGFAAVQVVDTRKDLNAYAKVENQSACCSPEPSSLPVADDGCCSAGPADEGLHRRLLELLRRYDVNDYAASVQVYAVKD
jgi:SAM-dependent methyltransferase